MKTKYLFTVITGLFILCSVFSFSLMATEKYPSNPGQEQNEKKDILQTSLQYRLHEYGINDFNTVSLINLMDSETSTIRLLVASLLGEKKERSAIPKLEEAVNDKSFYVVLAATKALLKMENRKGIKKLEEYCEKLSKEVEKIPRQKGTRNNGNDKIIEQSSALVVLADAGEVSAIPYLRKLLGNELWSLRLKAVRSLIKLYEKDKTVLKDIASMLEDDNPQVRKEAFDFLQKLEKNK